MITVRPRFGWKGSGRTVNFGLHTSALPVEHRFEAWSDFNAHAFPGVILESPHADDFVARVDVHDFGPMAISAMSNPPVRARRSAAMTRADGSEYVLITHVHSGGLVLDRAGTEVAVEANSLVAFDWARPLTVTNLAGFSSAVLQVPLAMVGLQRSEIEAIMARPMSSDNGVGGLLAYVMTDLTRHGHTYGPALVTHLTSTVIDLLGTATRLAHGGRETASRGRGLRREQVYAYIEQSLAEPTLSPAAIALAQGISIRQLDRLLRDDGTSPASYIRRRRLDHCRRDLVDPEMADCPISLVGAAWGFPDPAGFGRAFRREYGMSPGEYRRRYGPTARR
jgi:AraC-like DNA-binding protein